MSRLPFATITPGRHRRRRHQDALPQTLPCACANMAAATAPYRCFCPLRLDRPPQGVGAAETTQPAPVATGLPKHLAPTTSAGSRGNTKQLVTFILNQSTRAQPRGQLAQNAAECNNHHLSATGFNRCYYHHHHHNNNFTMSVSTNTRTQFLHNAPLCKQSKIAKLFTHSTLISLVVLSLTMMMCSVSTAMDISSPFGIYPSPPMTSPSGPSQCPLVPHCQCKWSNNKQEARCERRNLTQIPANLPQATQVLDLSGNNLPVLQPQLFVDKHLTNLQRLFLSECKISTIYDETFAHLTNLVELDLSHNNLLQIPVRSFESISNSLRRLNLAHNPVTVIDSDSFKSLRRLGNLDLSNMQLRELKAHSFRGLSELKELKLNDNKLTQLPMNVISDLTEYLIVDLFANPWLCDCELRQAIEWITRNHYQQSIYPSCAMPQKLKDIRWYLVKNEDFVCPPVVLNKQNELVVGAGSNVSLACTARGTPPLTFVWFQDEKNLTGSRANQSEPPASTKLLEEKRYEIAEELGPPGFPNITTSILYLINLKLTDTSLFLCWVDNSAGYSIANFSLIVNDSPPAHLNGYGSIGTNSISGSGEPSLGFLRALGLSQSEAQVGIITCVFLLIIVASVLFVLVIRQGNRSSKSSQASDVKHNHNNHSHHHQTIGSISAANKFSMHSPRGSRNGMLTESDEEEDDDHGDVIETSHRHHHHQQNNVHHHSNHMDAGHDVDYDDEFHTSADESGSSTNSCRKNPKVMAAAELDGFIEHMRSGIINMDYQTMSPVMQFNANNAAAAAAATNKSMSGMNGGGMGAQHMVNNGQLNYIDVEGTAMHHFPSSSNASTGIVSYNAPPPQSDWAVVVVDPTQPPPQALQCTSMQGHPNYPPNYTTVAQRQQYYSASHNC